MKLNVKNSSLILFTFVGLYIKAINGADSIILTKIMTEPETTKTGVANR